MLWGTDLELGAVLDWQTTLSQGSRAWGRGQASPMFVFPFCLAPQFCLGLFFY